MKTAVLTFACIAALAAPLTASGAESDTSQAVIGVAKRQPVVDESALRYFAAKGDKPRLEAEIARLRALYPDWVAPTDPLAAPDNADHQLAAMWKLYAEAKLPALRKAIADRKASEAGWVPPADLLARLAVAEKRLALIAASDQGKHADVVRLGAETPSLLTCNDVDILWRVADAFAHTDRLQRAEDAYGYILKSCTKPAERLATVQKASAVLGYTRMQALIGQEKTAPDGTGEFEPIRDDLARRFVAEGDDDGDLVVAETYLARVAKSLATANKASDALLLGWYYIKRDDMTPAEQYFRAAHQIEDSASAAQGLALTLIARKDPQEAESIMYRWRDDSEEAAATYFAATANLLAITPPPVLDGAILGRMAAAVTARTDVKTAEQFGWYALAFHQPKTAGQWFRLSLGWKADYEPAAYGLAVARLQMKDLAGVKDIQKVWAGRSERIATVTKPRRKTPTRDTIPSPDSVIDRSAMIDDYQTQSILPEARKSRDLITRGVPEAITISTRTPPGCRTAVDAETLSPQAALARGWCLMGLNRPLEAAKAFGVALQATTPKAREDAAYGQTLAYLRAGLINDAAVSATKAKLGLKRAVEVQTAILANRATNAFDAGRYRETILYLDQLSQLQTERTDLMVLRAFAYKNLNRRADALRIFEALAATGNSDSIRALGQMRSEATPQ